MIRALLLDRDGTLVEDVPYNGDPARVRPLPGAVDAVTAARRAGLRLALVSNQSGIARGLVSWPQLAAVNQRVEDLFGSFDVMLCCPHTDDDGCGCRKPAPGLVTRAIELLGVRPDECVLIGDRRRDVVAGLAAGCGAVLVPGASTPACELEALPCAVATDLAGAVALARHGPGGPTRE